MPNIDKLRSNDEVKFVIADRTDYEWARDLVRREGVLPGGTPVTFGAAEGWLQPRQLAEWILADRLEVRFQLQLHKVLWPDADRGV